MTTSNNLMSKPFRRAERHLQGKINSRYLQNYDHHVVPGYNLNKSLYVDECNVDTVKQLYQSFPYECDLPKPLLPPAKLPRSVLHEEDPALESILVKSHLKDDINRILDYCEKYKREVKKLHKRGLQWNKEEGKSTIVLPKYIAEMAELIELDPDPYLKGNYNWYYSGGSLCNVTLGDQTILLYPYVGELIASPLISMENALWKPKLKKSAKLNLDGTLYELKSSTVGDKCRILGRYKNHCVIYKLSLDENKLELFQIHKKTSSLPYISGDLSLFNQDYYCTVDVDHSICLWNTNKMKHISMAKIPHSKVLEDNWGSINYQLHDPNLLIFTDRYCLRYFDTRMPFYAPALKLCPQPHLEQCESISLEAGSKFEFCRYVGTYHSLLLCDSRSPEQCITQKWTHQFKSTPLLLPTINRLPYNNWDFRDNEEILVLSSLLAGENSVILNTWTNENPHSYNLPITPPNVMETLNESQLQGLCLDPYLKNRLELCNTGSTLLTNQSGDVFFFAQTSIGDIFYQCITHGENLDEYPMINEKSVSALSAWEEALLARNDPIAPLSITSKCDMTSIYKSFTNKKLELQDKNPKNDNINENWRQSVETLASYKDLLAPELLKAWDVNLDISIPLTAPPRDRVLNWLETTDIKASSSLVNNDKYIPATPVNAKESKSIPEDLSQVDFNDSQLLQELFLPKVRITSNKKKHRKK